jgi:hypothetical protein
MREMIEGFGKFRLPESGVGIRRLAVEQERLFEADCFVHFRQFFCRQPRLTARDRVAIARVIDGGRQQHRERQLTTLSPRRLLRQHPCTNRARNGERGKWAAGRDLVVANVPIKLRRGFGAGSSRSHQRPHAAGGLADQPESISPHVVHVRIDSRNAGRHREHCLKRVATFTEDRSAILNRGHVGGGHHAAAVSGRVESHVEATSARPRFFKSASTVGNLPRKDL